MTATTKVYIIGDKATGVLFVLFNPLRAALVSTATIEEYAARHNKSFEAVFGQIAGAAQGLITETDLTDSPATGEDVVDAFSTLIERGTTVTDAEFCFIADVDASDWTTLRNTFMPIEPIIGTMLSSFALAATSVPEGTLKGPGD